MNISNEDEVLDLFRRLHERLQQANGNTPNGNNPNGSHNTFVYVAPGAQYVNNLYQQPPLPDPPRRRGNEATEKDANPPFDADTPLSALFRESHHEELRQIIDSWRPFLIDDDPTTDALHLNSFQFDKKRIYSNRVYYDLLDLDAAGALQVSLSDLARYLSDHSNLSNSYATLYRLLKKYRQERSLASQV